MAFLSFVWIWTAFFAGFWLAYQVVNYAAKALRSQNFPPGPISYPIFGNLLQFPLKHPYITFREWGKRYGAIIGLKLGGQNFVVLNHWEDVKELFEKRGAIYSSRPDTYVQNEIIMVPNGIHILSMNYNHKLRLTRKLMSPLVNTSVVERAFPVQNAASTKLLRKLSETPENYHTLIQRFNGEVILATVYGLQDTGHNAQLLTRMFDTQERWSAIIEPGATPPIEVFPILKYAPEVVSPWKREAKWIRNSQQSIYGALMEATQQRIRDGKYLGCLMDDLLHEKNPQIGGQDLLHLGGTLLEAGLDTQSAMLQTFLMAMAAYPDIALQAQVEVDAVCGASRLPDFQDLEKFPFIKACVEETFRWRPVAPMGIPHALDRDDTHKSFFFPAGTTFVMNVWAMHMDPNEYDDPESFKPSRFLRNKFGTKYDPTASESAARRNHYGFGAGRRVCPGQRMGELNLYLTAAKLVWLFDMRYVGDGELDTSLTTGFKAGITVAPKEFPLELRIRSEERRAAMVKDLEKAEALLSTYYAK